MGHFSRLSLFVFVSFLASCEQKQTATISAGPVENYSMTGQPWADRDFTDWMSRAELLYLQENNLTGHYFATVEGRNHKGRLEYRTVNIPFPHDRYEQWAVFWGIDEAELFDWELRLLRTGFRREAMQVFQNPNNESIYQIVWLKPKGEQKQNITESVQTRDEDLSKPVEQASPPEKVLDAPVSGSLDLSEADVPQEPKLNRPVISQKENVKIYVIQPGDTLGKIASRHRVSSAALISANHLKSDLLRIGQKLTVPVGAN